MLALGAALAIAAAPAQPALADGDPASDVLASQSLFLPQDAGVREARQEQLVALLAAARRSGVPIRVAVIASPADLGSVSELWRRPQSYARFLAQELSLVYGGSLLVVMPDGSGFHGSGPTAARAGAAIAGLAPAGAVPGLDDAALTAIQRVAAAAGHPLAVPSATGHSPSASSSDTVAWLVFAAGAALIAIAWTLSLRARPLTR
jgi:hypothetical protein